MEKKKNPRKGIQDTEERTDSKEREMDAQELEIYREESGEAEKEHGSGGLNPSDKCGQEYARERDNAASVQEKSGAAENRFTREQLLSSTRFRDRRDLLNALLSPGQAYSIADVEQMIDNYRKGKVK